MSQSQLRSRGRVSVIIPTRNEAHSIGRVLSDLPPDLVTEVLFVDSNSTDGTPEIAAKMGARVVQEPRRGSARACLTGLAKANAADIVVFLDGDYSDRPAELPVLLAPIVDELADITLGSRLGSKRTRGVLPWHAAVRGLRIVEVPVSYYPGIGKSKISGTLPGTLGAAWFIFSLIVGYYFRRRVNPPPAV